MYLNLLIQLYLVTIIILLFSIPTGSLVINKLGEFNDPFTFSLKPKIEVHSTFQIFFYVILMVSITKDEVYLSIFNKLLCVIAR